MADLGNEFLIFKLNFLVSQYFGAKMNKEKNDSKWQQRGHLLLLMPIAEYSLIYINSVIPPYHCIINLCPPYSLIYNEWMIELKVYFP